MEMGPYILRLPQKKKKVKEISMKKNTDNIKGSKTHNNYRHKNKCGYWTKNLDGDEMSWSKKIYDILGIEPGQADQSFKTFMQTVHPSNREKVKNELEKCIETGEPTQIEYSILLPNEGEQQVKLECDTSCDKEGNPVSLSGTLCKVSTLNYIDERVQSQQLLHTCKLITLGSLVPGIIHEINNPTNYIHLNSEILIELWNDTLPILEQYYNANGDFLLGGVSFFKFKNKIKKYIEDISQGSNRIKKEISHLQRFAQTAEKEDFLYINIFEVVNSAINLMSYQLRKKTRRFFVECEKNLPTVRGNLQQLELVVISLIINSIQSMQKIDDYISLTVKTDKKKENIEILLKDEGAGISSEHLACVKHPFFTTKALNGNIGLGLAYCDEVIKNHRGEFLIDSMPGKGTTVKVILPIDQPKSDKSEV